jgi:predicted NBD/HSP70 family sugar kinase
MNLLPTCGIVKAMPTAGNIDRDEPVRQRSLRQHNLGLVLRHVAASPRPVSRADLAGVTGLTKATVSALVDELLGGGLLDEVAPPPRTGAGRPAVGLTVAAQGPAGLGLEVNVDYLAACVLDLTGTQRRLEIRRGDQRGRLPDRVLGDLARLAAEVVAAADGDGLRVAGVAVGVPGLVAGGVVRLAPNLDWRDVDVTAALRARARDIGIRLDGPGLTVDNEANLAALAELHAGRVPRASFVYISGEIGVGAGVVLEGRLLRGSRGYGGELGHVTIHPNGVVCRCGARGCLEAYANQETLMRSAGLEPAVGVDRLVQLARAGASPALQALADVGAVLGVAAADVVNLLDVDTVVLGGIYAPLTPWLAEPVAREIAKRTITSGWAPVAVRASALGTTATVVGAAGSVVRAIRDAPAPWLTQLSSE